MKRALQAFFLVLALAGFIVFLSFHFENVGPKQTITVGINTSPWLRYTWIKGIGDIGKKVEINFFSWSAAGLLVAVGALVLRTRVK